MKKKQIKPLKYLDLHLPLHLPLKSSHKSAKGNKVVYKKLVSLKSSSPVKSQSKWNSNIASDEGRSADWKTAYGVAAKCTKSTTLVNFQYRFLHRILPTNLFLTKIGIKQDPDCSFCSNAPENLIYFSGIVQKSNFFGKP